MFSAERCDFVHVIAVIYHRIPPRVLDLMGRPLCWCTCKLPWGIPLIDDLHATVAADWCFLSSIQGLIAVNWSGWQWAGVVDWRSLSTYQLLNNCPSLVLDKRNKTVEEKNMYN